MNDTLRTCSGALALLRREMDAWLRQSRRLDPPGQQGGGEDEANYALAWLPHYLVTRKPECLSLFNSLEQELVDWVERDCVLGYEAVAEAHHGPEPFILFLPRYGRIASSEVASGLIGNAARHILNACEGVPEWYDWDRDRFHSYHIGTETVGEDRAAANELAEHFRFLHLALAAHRFSGGGRHLEWALRYGRKRSERILAAPEGPLPVLWDVDGQPVWESGLTDAQRGMSAASHHLKGDPLIGVEVLLASGATYALGDLFEVSGDPIFRDAARRILEPLVDEICDPYCDPGAAALNHYRRTFRDATFDEALRLKIDAMPDEEEGEWVMLFPEVYRRRLPGVGKRADMVVWGKRGDDGVVQSSREPSTAALTLAYDIIGDTTFAARALDQAARKLKMARRVLRGGREHADMGGAICSVAAGHGRNWGIGAVTGCYGPLLLGTRPSCGTIDAALSIEDDDGKEGVPMGLLPLVQSGPDTSRVTFYNSTESATRFAWSADGDTRQPESLKPGEGVERALENRL